jgi:hypothetical protein
MSRWFRKKACGYGWTPCTWQGWVAMAVFTGGIVAASVKTKELGPQNTVEIVAALTVVLLAITVFTSGNDSDP